MSFTYADVDGATTPSRPSTVLDIGCGVGDDARALGAIGLDPSMTMLTEARKRGGAFVRGDVLSLPIPIAARVLGGVRTDRVLQHVADPDSALDELARVLRRGGVVVLAEPDQSTLVIEGTDSELTPAMLVERSVWIADEAQRFTDSLGSEAFRYTVDVVVTRGTR